MLVGQELRFRYLSAHRTSIGSLGASLESSSGQPVAWFRLYGPGELASMACREGTWSLNKRRKYGWELLIESGDGRHVGWYSGRRWLLGGTIIFADGVRVDLRRSRKLGWKLQVRDTREVIAEFSHYRSASASASVTIRSLPTEIYSDTPVVVLTACAVLMLIGLAMPVGGGGGGG